jgi:hypothetical protein
LRNVEYEAGLSYFDEGIQPRSSSFLKRIKALQMQLPRREDKIHGG